MESQAIEPLPKEVENLPIDNFFVEMVDAIEEGECSTSTTTVDVVTRRRKKRSLVWTYFDRVNDGHARCCACGDQILTSGNTTNMVKVSKSLKLCYLTQHEWYVDFVL